MSGFDVIEPVLELNHPRKVRTCETLKIVTVHVAVVTFLVFATLKNIERAKEIGSELTLCSEFGRLLFVLHFAYFWIFYYGIVKPYAVKHIKKHVFLQIQRRLKDAFKVPWLRLMITIGFLMLIAGYIAYETTLDLTRLRALIGIASIILIGFVFSTNPKKINWRTVIGGAVFQFILGIFCIRLSIGRTVLECLGNQVSQFLDCSKEGASFVFGNFLVSEINVFAFSVLPTVFFFSMCISVLHYLGVMQSILLKLGWILRVTLDTTVCESFTAAGSIFLGVSELPLMIRPYIDILTHSEIHSVMVSSLATVSGTVLAAYISFGAEAKHLIAASIMAAPASLFFSKLIYPETEESKTTLEIIQIERSSDSSVLDAASNGASLGINLILNIIATLVAFVAFIAFADGVLKWSTHLIGFENVGIQFILGKAFIPISWSLGVEWVDCEAVANVIGTKTVINEFVAYQRLGEYKRTGSISLRSSAIASYAICGFANPSSMGIMIGVLSALAPERRPSITKIATRAFISGCLVPLLTACIAALLMSDEKI